MPNLIENIVENQLRGLYETVNNPACGIVLAGAACAGTTASVVLQDAGAAIVSIYSGLFGAMVVGGVIAKEYDIPYAIAGTVGAIATPSLLVGSLAGDAQVGLDMAKAGAIGVVAAYGAISSCRAMSAERVVENQQREMV